MRQADIHCCRTDTSNGPFGYRPTNTFRESLSDIRAGKDPGPDNFG